MLYKDFDPNVYKFLSCIRWRDARLNFLTRPSRASSRGSSKKSASKLTKSPHSNKTRLLQLSVLWAPEKFVIYQGFIRLNTVMIVFSLDTDMYLLAIPNVWCIKNQTKLSSVLLYTVIGSIFNASDGIWRFTQKFPPVHGYFHL